jgi:hypothetical protein
MNHLAFHQQNISVPTFRASEVQSGNTLVPIWEILIDRMPSN